MKAKHTVKKLGRCCLGLLLLMTMIHLSSVKSPGYIMPAEQLIGFMASNFTKFKTLVIIQSTLKKRAGVEDSETVSKEQIWVKSPNLFHFKLLDRSEDRTEDRDNTFRRLLIANKKVTLEELLSERGINLRNVAFTRIDGTIAYRIGDKGPESPKLFVEKERFLPLFMQYRFREAPGGDTVTVRFKDYRKLDEGWYPFEIIYTVSGKTMETYAIQTLEANVTVNPSLFYATGDKPTPLEAPAKVKALPDEERLKKIIEATEKKYQ